MLRQLSKKPGSFRADSETNQDITLSVMWQAITVLPAVGPIKQKAFQGDRPGKA
jgi:hypothetical protein